MHKWWMWGSEATRDDDDDWDPAKHEETCEQCKGTGEILLFQFSEKCDACGGVGRIEKGDKCDDGGDDG
jgi:DnaJ-class molecular chaperone